jgi:hypothetical protein
MVLPRENGKTSLRFHPRFARLAVTVAMHCEKPYQYSKCAYTAVGSFG